jgi:hypothetical protein
MMRATQALCSIIKLSSLSSLHDVLQVVFSVIALATAASIPMWPQTGAFRLLLGAAAASLAAAALLGAWQWLRVVQAGRQDRGAVRGWAQATPVRLLWLSRPYFLLGQVADSVRAPCCQKMPF